MVRVHRVEEVQDIARAREAAGGVALADRHSER